MSLQLPSTFKAPISVPNPLIWFPTYSRCCLVVPVKDLLKNQNNNYLSLVINPFYSHDL